MCSEHLLSKNNDILPFSFQQWNESEWWKKVFYLQQGGEIIKILCCVALVYNSFFFFRTGVFKRKLFDIRFSYKRCNFSRGCLLVKMASKTVTRSIRPSNRPVVYWSKKGKDKVTKVVTPIKKKTRHRAKRSKLQRNGWLCQKVQTPAERDMRRKDHTDTIFTCKFTDKFLEQNI